MSGPRRRRRLAAAAALATAAASAAPGDVLVSSGAHAMFASSSALNASVAAALSAATTSVAGAAGSAADAAAVATPAPSAAANATLNATAVANASAVAAAVAAAVGHLNATVAGGGPAAGAGAPGNGSALADAVGAAVARWNWTTPNGTTTTTTSAAAAAAAFAGSVVAGLGGSAAGGADALGPGSESHVACQLVATSFGWWLQVFLGSVCFVSLVGKRFTDRIRRPWKIWFFDTSKQGVSNFLIHFLNILLSMAFGRWLDADADPCNWYWINLTLDDSIGVGIQFLLLKVLQCIYRMKCVGRPELALTGEYGDPPDVHVFTRQLLDWQALVLLQKCILAVFVVNCTSQVAAVAGFLLGWLDPFPRAKLVVVMVITPLVMNVFALWMADSFLQGDPTLARGERIQASESLVCGQSPPSIVGQQNGAASPTDADFSGDEFERVVGFQEWKRRTAAKQHRPTKLSGTQSSDWRGFAK